MSAGARFKTFDRRYYLIEHIQKHLRLLKEGEKLLCPHPKCRYQIRDETLMDHFEYTHAIELTSRNGIEKAWRKRKSYADPEECKPPKKKKSSGTTNNSSKTQDDCVDTLLLNDQFKDSGNVPSLGNQSEDLEHSNGSSPNERLEDFDNESVSVNRWEKGRKDFMPPFDNQLKDLEHSNGSSNDDQSGDLDQESLFVDGWEKGWEDFLDGDRLAMLYYDTDVVNIDPYIYHPY